MVCDLLYSLRVQLCALRIKVRWLDHACMPAEAVELYRNILVHPSHSSIRLHVESKCDDVDVTENSFKVLSSSPNNLDLRILESLYIFKTRPKLNGNASALPLHIVNA